MNRKINIATLLTLIGIFLLSALVRFPNINRPLSKHHEFVTAVSLRVVQVWHEEGAAKYNFNPVMNYPGVENKFINNHASTTGTMMDEKGNYYYVSHPPFAYILPHVVFRVINVKPTVLSIQIFHLVLNFISAFFIYLIICLLGQQRPFGSLYPAAVVGFLVYVFNPAVLWFQCNTYMSDMLVHVFFVIGVYIMLKLLMRKRFLSPKYLVYYGLVLFLMIYTSWLGLFFGFSVFFYSIIKLRNEKVFLPIIFITIGVTVATLCLIFQQYSSINGADAFVIQMLNRIGERGSVGGNGIMGFLFTFLRGLKTLLINYGVLYLPIYLLLSTFAFLVLFKAKLRMVFTKNGYRFLWISTMPILLLHFFLLNYSGHNFTSLYGAVFLTVLIAILYDKLVRGAVLSKLQANGGVAVVMLLSLVLYFFVNRPGEFSWKGDRYADDMEMGLKLKEEKIDDSMLFWMGSESLSPMVIIYAEQNVLRVESEEEAQQELGARGLHTGQLFLTSKGEGIVEIRRISP